MYHYITIDVVMRDCYSIEDAIEKCSQLMPYNPDENTTHMESWNIETVHEAATGRTRDESGKWV